MRPPIDLRTYVLRRNGVPLGHRKSLQNMLHRSLGSGHFAGFWNYWNPIWSYYLSYYLYLPLRKVLPRGLALFLTFVGSGFIHDLVIIGLRQEFVLVLSPWFALMASLVLPGRALNWNYKHLPWFLRAFINLLQVFLPLALVLGL